MGSRGGEDDMGGGSVAGRRTAATTLAVLAVGLLATGALAVAALTARERNEDRLIRQRTREASAVLASNLPTVELTLASSVEVAEETNGDTASFRRLMQPLVAEGGSSSSASLWEVTGGRARLVVFVGDRPALTSEPDGEVASYLDRAARSSAVAVADLLDAEPATLGYASSSPRRESRYVTYAEARLEETRSSYEREDEAFADLDLAVYLGESERSDRLIVATTPDLPITGRRATASAPFGDTTLLLVASPRDDLGGELLAVLPWLIAAVGAVVSIGYAVLALRLLRRRSHAEHLASDNARLYGEQRSVAQTLQRSLLPERLPAVPGLELAARYEAGVEGLDIGGDWYDVVPTGETTVLLVVGDVSGRGLGAATVMASLRYAIRAYAIEGHGPEVILEKLGHLLRLERDGHFATVLCATVDSEARTFTVASAGHPPPLVVEGDAGRFLDLPIGAPVGVPAEGGGYLSRSFTFDAGTALLVFTDGLFERRGEVVDAGLERLRQTAGRHEDSLDGLLGAIVVRMAAAGTRDDTAILGVRWLS